MDQPATTSPTSEKTYADAAVAQRIADRLTKKTGNKHLAVQVTGGWQVHEDKPPAPGIKLNLSIDTKPLQEALQKVGEAAASAGAQFSEAVQKAFPPKPLPGGAALQYPAAKKQVMGGILPESVLGPVHKKPEMGLALQLAIKQPDLVTASAVKLPKGFWCKPAEHAGAFAPPIHKALPQFTPAVFDGCLSIEVEHDIMHKQVKFYGKSGGLAPVAAQVAFSLEALEDMNGTMHVIEKVAEYFDNEMASFIMEQGLLPVECACPTQTPQFYYLQSAGVIGKKMSPLKPHSQHVQKDKIALPKIKGMVMTGAVRPSYVVKHSLVGILHPKVLDLLGLQKME